MPPNPYQSPEKKGRKARLSLQRLLVGLAVVLALYPLSYGPYRGMLMNDRLPMWMYRYESLYDPVLWVAGLSPATDEALRRYVVYWCWECSY